MKPSCRKFAYPVNVSRIASDVAARGIDIAPTRITWELLARCLAGYAGEQGRDAFHQMAAVWPDYSRHDSEMCYNRALRQTGKQVSIGYLKGVLKRLGIDIDHPRYRASGPLQPVKPNPKTTTTTKTMKNIPFNSLMRSLPGNRPVLGRNLLIDLLLRLYPQQAVLMACERYLIGFNSFITGEMGDALIFWQVDDKRKIVNAKSINYRFDGHRDKKMPPMVLYPGNPQCLFGQHLLGEDPTKPIAIVESEKTALIMSIVMPEFVWMACGSLNNFNEHFLKPLRHRTIIAFPDVDYTRNKESGYSVSTDAWIKVANRLKAEGWKISVNMSLEKKATTPQRLDKCDIADIALEEAKQAHFERLKHP